jgi:hypothetical protein
LLSIVCCGVYAAEPAKTNGVQHEARRVKKTQSFCAKTWNEVAEIVSKYVDNMAETLVLVDVDNVLTYAKDPCTYPVNMRAYRAILSGKSPEQMDAAWAKVFMSVSQQTLDNDSVKVIRDWREGGATVYSVTALVAGKNDEVIKRRNKDMQEKFGIGPVLHSTQRNEAGVFFSSCGSTDGSDRGKGDAGLKLLQLLEKRPKCVIMIDDNASFLANGRSAFHGKVDFVSIQYTGSETQIPNAKVTMERFEKFWRKYF